MNRLSDLPNPRALVLGGTGFIGRHAVDALLARGAAVRIGSRRPDRSRRRLSASARACRLEKTPFEILLTAEHWDAVLRDTDVVVNCVGILRPRGGETYDRVHHLAPAALAVACRERGIRLVHVSALGLAGLCRSGFLRSKQAGESALKASGVEGCIVRPSLLDAPSGGYGAAWIRRVAHWPWLALPVDATGRIAAMDVRDLGEALAVLALDSADAGLQEVELGGPQALPLREYLAALRRGLGYRSPARIVPLPGWLARGIAHVCDVVHLTPYSFGHWELLRQDNCPAVNQLPALLGRRPRDVVAVGTSTDAPPLALPENA